MARQARRLAALFAWSVTIAGAQDPFGEARRLNNEGAAFYAQGEFDAAERLYRTALSLSAGDPLNVAKIATNLGVLYKRLNRYAEAELLYKQALDVRRKRLPLLRPEIADSMNNLAEIYRLEGRYWEARNLAEAAVRALERADPQSPDMPVFLNNWAGLERDLRHPDQAEQLLRQAWTLAESAGEPAAGSLALVMNTLAQVLADRHDYESAERLCLHASDIFARGGPDSNHFLAAALANLGRMQTMRGRDEEGRQTELRALALVDAEAHPDDLLRSAILRNLGNVAAREGKVADALGYFAQSLSAHERVLGQNHPAIASVLFEYAAVAGRAGEKSQARKLRKRAELLEARRRHDDLSRYTADASAFVNTR